MGISGRAVDVKFKNYTVDVHYPLSSTGGKSSDVHFYIPAGRTGSVQPGSCGHSSLH